MREEIKLLLKSEIKTVNRSRLKVIVGAVLLLSNIVLAVLGVLSIITILFSVILVIVLLNQIANHRINRSVLYIRRYIIDDEFMVSHKEKKQ